ncbi:MAG TPA: hypothetical protein PKN80_04725 [bacterium]|uniref:Trehalose utilization n=1 Tax=candidate division TA06 bacterium ADurb.Bin417 TaxID=1852828 RepID=A0A1V5MIJ4_UNCT6|nr:MAG: Trehalose utilization [candidate division TA06 bacterium ADurb.Bin417]HNQ35352.1 hypothetical protein [bacterium]
MKMRKGWSTLIAAALLMTAAAGLYADDTPVGIYFNPVRGDDSSHCYGYEGTRIALEENGFDNVSYVKSLKAEDLKGIKVLIMSCVLGYPRGWDLKQVKEEQRRFVENGGGLVLIQESIGWRGIFKDNPIFPEFGRGVAHDGKSYGPVQLTPLLVIDKKHPITRDLPDQFPMQYDAAPLKPGEKGRVLIMLSDDAIVRSVKTKIDKMAALIVGEHGKGRVVLIGPLVGVSRLPREMENPPAGGELKMLLNSVRWAAGGN